MSNRKEKKHQCAVCKFSSNHRSHLTRHERIHTGDKPFKCDKCNYAFTSNSDLLRHIRKHTGEKPYKCDQCNSCFSLNAHLIRHKRIHTGEKPYKCDHCNSVFADNSYLLRHKRTHTGEKPFKCEQCNHAFADSSALKQHKRTHTGEKPYKCDQCNLAFTRNPHLTAHKRIHTGEKPYKCDQCDYVCPYKFHLTIYKSKNSGEKSYKCNQCSSGLNLLEEKLKPCFINVRRLNDCELNSWNASSTPSAVPIKEEVIEGKISESKNMDLITNTENLQEYTRQINETSAYENHSIAETVCVKVEIDIQQIPKAASQWTNGVGEVPTGVLLPHGSNSDTKLSVQIEDTSSSEGHRVLNSGIKDEVIDDEIVEFKSFVLPTNVEKFQESMRDNNYILPIEDYRIVESVNVSNVKEEVDLNLTLV